MAGQPSLPTESYDYYLRALMMESQGNFVSAIESLDKAIELNPDSAYLHRTRAELLLRLGNISDAAEEIEDATRLDPEDVKALILAGQIQWAMGNNIKAEENLKRAVTLAPDESEAIVSLAGTLTARKPEEAIKLYKDFLVRHPDEIGILERLAQLYQNVGKPDQSKKTWNEIIELSPSYQRAHLALAQLAEVVSDTTTAISHYERVLQDDPDNLALLLRVGELRYRSNDMPKAYEAFSMAQSIAPNSASANFWLALLSENRGEWNEAIHLLEQVAVQGPEPAVLLRLAYYYSQAGRFKEAIKTLKKLSDLQPTNTDFLGYLAVAYEQDKDWVSAQKVNQAIIKLDPQNADIHYRLATLHDRQGRFPKAESELKLAISLKPDFHAAMNYLGYSYVERDIKLDEAERLLMSAIGLDPQNPAYMDSVGWLFYRQGKLKQADDFLKEAALLADDPVVWDHFGTVQAAQGEYISALLSWDEALRLEATSSPVLKKSQIVFKKLSPNQKIDFLLRRSINHFGDMGAVQGVCKISGCEGKPCLPVSCQWNYTKEGELKVEVPGPLSAPVMQLRKKHGQSAQYGAIHPQFQLLEPYIIRAFDRIESVISGDVFKLRPAEIKNQNVSDKNGKLRYVERDIEFVFTNKNALLEKIHWTESSGHDTLRLEGFSWFSETRKNLWPSLWEWEDSASSIRIKIEFSQPLISLISQSSGESKEP